MKKDNILLKKTFIKKLEINLCSSKVDFFVCNFPIKSVLSNRLTIKTDLYTLIKSLQLLKSLQIVSNNTNSLQSFGFKMQLSKLYSSFSETERSHLLKLLIRPIKKKLIVNKNSFSKNLLFLSNKVLKKRKLTDFSGFKNYNKNFTYKSLQSFPQLLNKKRFYCKLVKSRVLFSLKNLKTKYRTLKKSYKVLTRLSFFFVCKYRYFRIKKKKEHRRFRKLLWRIKKRKKRKGRFLKGRVRFLYTRLYPRRFRFHYRFYIPRFLEINYKTFSFLRLTHYDKFNVDSKIPFSFNIRKLLTFTSS